MVPSLTRLHKSQLCNGTVVLPLKDLNCHAKCRVFVVLGCTIDKQCTRRNKLPLTRTTLHTMTVSEDNIEARMMIPSL